MTSGIKRVFVTPLDDASTTDKEGLGTIRWEGNKCYKYILYENGTAAVAGVAGEVAYYDEDDGPITNVVTSDLSDATGEVGAGVLQAALDSGAAGYGWIQIKGPATLTIALTAGADGDSLTPSGAGDGTLDLLDAAETDHNCAQAVDATAKIIACDFPF